MNIRDLAYELYKIDWMRRISAGRQMDALRNFYEECGKDDPDECFTDYISEHGYDGELYLCYEEFIGFEYQDKWYMKSLLDNEELFKEYKEDIGQ